MNREPARFGSRQKTTTAADGETNGDVALLVTAP